MGEPSSIFYRGAVPPARPPRPPRPNKDQLPKKGQEEGRQYVTQPPPDRSKFIEPQQFKGTSFSQRAVTRPQPRPLPKTPGPIPKSPAPSVANKVAKPAERQVGKSQVSRPLPVPTKPAEREMGRSQIGRPLPVPTKTPGPSVTNKAVKPPERPVGRSQVGRPLPVPAKKVQILNNITKEIYETERTFLEGIKNNRDLLTSIQKEYEEIAKKNPKDSKLKNYNKEYLNSAINALTKEIPTLEKKLEEFQSIHEQTISSEKRDALIEAYQASAFGPYANAISHLNSFVPEFNKQVSAFKQLLSDKANRSKIENDFLQLKLSGLIILTQRLPRHKLLFEELEKKGLFEELQKKGIISSTITSSISQYIKAMEQKTGNVVDFMKFQENLVLYSESKKLKDDEITAFITGLNTWKIYDEKAEISSQESFRIRGYEIYNKAITQVENEIKVLEKNPKKNPKRLDELKGLRQKLLEVGKAHPKLLWNVLIHVTKKRAFYKNPHTLIYFTEFFKGISEPTKDQLEVIQKFKKHKIKIDKDFDKKIKAAKDSGVKVALSNEKDAINDIFAKFIFEKTKLNKK